MKCCRYQEDFIYPDTQVHFHLYSANFFEVHCHDYWEFFIIKSGEIKHQFGNQSQILGAGIGCLVHPSDQHCFTSASKDYEQINIMITDDFFKQLLSIVDADLYSMIEKIKNPITYELDNSAMNEIEKMIQSLHTSDSANKSVFVNMIKLMWFDIIKNIYTKTLHSHKMRPDWLNNFIMNLHRPQNIPKPVSYLYSLTNFSHSHLTRLFKQYTGMTVTAYQQQIRLNYGAMLLRTTDFTIMRISSEVGYDSLSHFERKFKGRFGVSPNKYKAQYTPSKP